MALFIVFIIIIINIQGYNSNESESSFTSPDSEDECQFPSGKETSSRILFNHVSSIAKCNEYNARKDTISPNFPLIINGEFAEKAEFPHMALLGYNNKDNIKWLCGGSLISEDYILTAAHCLYHEQYGQVKYVRLGELDYNNTIDEINPEDYGIRNVTLHPKYTASSHYHDIALIQLDREVKFTPQVKPACLYPNNTTPSPLIITGWGRTAYFHPQSSHLMKAVVYPTNSTVCKRAYGITPKLCRGVLDDLQFCAGYEGRDACPGDSGGPIQAKNYYSSLKRYYFSIVGITSFGRACGFNNAGGYTKIFAYISWIEDIVWNDYAQGAPAGDEAAAPIVFKNESKSYTKCILYHAHARSGSSGVRSLAEEFPHMAALGYGDINDINWLCAGTLISEKFILTAAHCTNTREFGPVKFVRLGELDLNSTTDIAQPVDFNIVNIHRHPQFNSKSYYNDIALLELDKTVNFNSFIMPACLYSNTALPDVPPTVTGWGRTSYIGPPSTQLLKAQMKFVGYDDCAKIYKPTRKLPNGIIDGSQICAGNREEIEGCAGNLGAPIQIKYDDMEQLIPYYIVIGVTSFGKDCGFKAPAGVYTRVAPYVSWIENIVWKD